MNEDYSLGIRTDKQNNQVAGFSLNYDRDVSETIRVDASAYAQLMWLDVHLGARPDYSVLDHTEYDDGMKFGQLFKADFVVADFNTITVGLDSTYTLMDRHHDYYLVERDARAKGNRFAAAMFAQDEMSWRVGAQKVILTPGVRVDYAQVHARFGRELGRNFSKSIEKKSAEMGSMDPSRKAAPIPVEGRLVEKTTNGAEPEKAENQDFQKWWIVVIGLSLLGAGFVGFSVRRGRSGR